MKKFILKVEHDKGCINVITNTPDLLTAIQKFKQHTRGLYGKDKSTITPNIISAKIEEINFDITD